MGLKRFTAAFTAVSVIITGAVCTSSLPDSVYFCSSAVSTGTIDLLTYQLYEDHAEIVKCDRSAVTAKVPDTIENKPVTVIGEGAFTRCESMTSITMPDTITAISDYAFSGCSKLKLSKLPASLTYIGSHSFSYCDQITDLVFPSGLMEISDSAFYWCDTLKTVKSEGSVESIGARAFIYCEDLESADLGTGVKTIGESAFQDCTRLTEFSSLENVETIGYHAFRNCPVNVKINPSVMTGHQSDLIGRKYQRTGDVVRSYITDITSDTVATLTANDNKFLLAESFSYVGTNYKLISQKAITFELPVFGGCYSNDKYNFLFFGQTNYTENDNCEVIRVVKYDKDWNRLASGSVKGSDIYFPFDGGSLRADDNGTTMGVYTCRTMYRTEDGLHHQSSFAFTVDIESMEVTQMKNVYASHSFDQYVKAVGNGFRFVDHGDAYPRTVDIQDEKGFSVDVLRICGEMGDNNTGVSLGGFEQSSDKLIIAGNSMDQNQTGNINYNARRDIFIGVADKTLKSSEFRWITDHRNSDALNEPIPATPVLVKVNDNLFYLMWEEYTPDSDTPDIKLTMLDGSGNKTSDIFSLGKGNRLSDCQPVISPDGAITWYYIPEDGDSIHFVSFRPGGETAQPATVPSGTHSPVQTTTAPVQPPSSSVTTPTQSQLAADEIRLTCRFSGFTLHKGESVIFTFNKSDGVIKQMQIMTVDSSGAPDVISCGADSGKYLAGPGTSSEVFTAPYDLQEIKIVMIYSGAEPVYEMAFAGLIPTTVPAGLCGDANCDDKINVATQLQFFSILPIIQSTGLLIRDCGMQMLTVYPVLPAETLLRFKRRMPDLWTSFRLRRKNNEEAARQAASV